MNITIGVSRLKKYLKDKHNLDLTNRIERVTNWSELPIEFERIVQIYMLRRYLSLYGLLFFIKGNKRYYLIQERNDNWRCFSTKGDSYDLSEVYEDIGVPSYLGLNPYELYELYGKEN
jgi:hypothetical protein